MQGDGGEDAAAPWSPGEAVRRPVSAIATIGRRYRVLFLQCWRAHRGLTLASLALALAAGALPVAISVLTGVLVGGLPAAAGQGMGSAAGRHVLWAFGGFLVVLILSSIRVHVGEPVANALTTHYVAMVQDVVATAGLGPRHLTHLEDPRTAAHLGAVQEALREGGLLNGVTSLIYVTGAKLSALGGAVVLFTIRWWAPLPLLVGMVAFDMGLNRWLATVFDQLVESTGTRRRRAEYVRTLMSAPAAAKEIRVFGLSDHLLQRYTRTWTEAMRQVWGHRRSRLWPIHLATVVMLGSYVLVYGLLVDEAYHGALSLPELAVAITATGVLRSLAAGGDPRTNLARATVLAVQIDELERRYPAAALAERGGDGSAASVRLQDVAFTYAGAEAATLEGLTLDIPAGQSVAVVGANGAGKSTVIKLLTGLHRPDRGRIRIGDADVGGTEPPAAGRVAVIFQDFARYPLSLRENVGFGNLPALGDDAMIRRALADAGATTVLDRVGGDLGTVLSSGFEGGTDLSGGQWQRVALARALAALAGGAGVLILDEPTAALDVRAETELFDRFLQVTRGVTTILVSHRLSSVRRVDRIVVLEGGAVVEDGSHDELMAAGGRYAHMFTLQAQRFAETGDPDVAGAPDA